MAGNMLVKLVVKLLKGRGVFRCSLIFLDVIAGMECGVTNTLKKSFGN